MPHRSIASHVGNHLPEEEYHCGGGGGGGGGEFDEATKKQA